MTKRGSYPKVQKTYTGEMQVSIPTPYGGVDVYNFKDATKSKHSHIHYRDKYDDNTKSIHRSLENSKHDWSMPKYADVEYVLNTNYFDYDFESFTERLISSLTKEELIILKNYFVEIQMQSEKQKSL